MWVRFPVQGITSRFVTTVVIQRESILARHCCAKLVEQAWCSDDALEYFRIRRWVPGWITKKGGGVMPRLWRPTQSVRMLQNLSEVWMIEANVFKCS
jgi:hypothetical protein